MTIEHRRFELDGVVVHHFPSDDAVTSAVLTFGVGMRNETLPTGGTLHLLEHLVMNAARRTPIEVNASVDASTTEFEAKGSPERVREFLESVCAGLFRPPTERLAAEVKVLDAEHLSDGGAPGSGLSLARHGWRDLGIVGGPVAGAAGISSELVRETAARWFVTGNAVLVVDGPWPADLRLPLTRDEPTTRPPIEIRRFNTPHAVLVEEPVCGVSLMLPSTDDHRELVAATVLRRRLEEGLRHEQGLIYDLDRIMTGSGDGRWDLQLYAEPAPKHARQTVRTMVGAVLDLLRNGPRAAELEEARALAVEESRGRAATIGFIADAEITRLLGAPVPLFDPQLVLDLDAESLTVYLRQAAGDVLFMVDESTAPVLSELGVEIWPGPGVSGPLPAGEVFRPGLVARAVSRDARETRVVLLPDGLAHLLDGLGQIIRWSDVVGVMRLAEAKGDVVVFGADGSSIAVGPQLYRHGARVIETLERRVSPALFYDEPPEPHDPR